MIVLFHFKTTNFGPKKGHLAVAFNLKNKSYSKRCLWISTRAATASSDFKRKQRLWLEAP